MATPTHAIALSAIFCLDGTHVAKGATETWDGGGGDNLVGTGANWLDDSQPSANDDLIFAGTTRLMPTSNYGAYTQFGTVTFAENAGAFTLVAIRSLLPGLSRTLR